MNDTSPEIAKKIREMFQKKSSFERLKMGFSMHQTSKYLVSCGIDKNTPLYSAADLRQRLFLNFYGNDFDPKARQKIFDHFGPTTVWKEPESKIEDTCNFEHIPSSEKGEKWWRLLSPLIQARLKRGNKERSTLLKILGRSSGYNTWKNIKTSIEFALDKVKAGESILARSSEIKNNPDPDGIIDDMFAELRSLPYLLKKGFTNVSYSRRKGLDFKADLNGQTFHIEATYVHGPGFKTQEYGFNHRIFTPIYKILPDKLIALFERIYSSKREQVVRNHHGAHDSFIIMVTDLEETYAPWLEHAQIQGRHPLVNLILSRDIPTVILGCGSIYEPNFFSGRYLFSAILDEDMQ